MMITGKDLRAAAGKAGVGVGKLTDQLSTVAPGNLTSWDESTVRCAAALAGYNMTSLAEILKIIRRDKEMADTFTDEELINAGNRLGQVEAVAVTLKLLRSPRTADAVISAASEAGYCSRMTDVLDEARRLRQPVIENDDDTLTVEELTEAMKRVIGSWSSSTVEWRVSDIMRDIRAHREPDYPEGTVVEDAQGRQWKRRDAGWSRRNWSTDIFPLSEPRRPLAVI